MRLHLLLTTLAAGLTLAGMSAALAKDGNATAAELASWLA